MINGLHIFIFFAFLFSFTSYRHSADSSDESGFIDPSLLENLQNNHVRSITLLLKYSIANGIFGTSFCTGTQNNSNLKCFILDGWVRKSVLLWCMLYFFFYFYFYGFSPFRIKMHVHIRELHFFFSAGNAEATKWCM